VIFVEDWALIAGWWRTGFRSGTWRVSLVSAGQGSRRAVAPDVPPKYERKPAPTSFSPFEARVRALLAEYQEMPMTVIAERVGRDGSVTWSRDNPGGCGPSIAGLIQRVG
jgi:hypothetical protein